MTQAKHGDEVKVHYTGKLDDGTVFDSSVKKDPLQFKIGKGQVIPGFEQGVIGMEPGELKTTKVPADKAYGAHREEMLLEIDRSRLPSNLKPEIGQQLEIPQEDGRKSLVTISNVSESNITLDANHPLAGKDLTFDIKLLEIL